MISRKTIRVLRPELQVIMAVSKCITSKEEMNPPFRLREWSVTKGIRYVCFKDGVEKSACFPKFPGEG